MKTVADKKKGYNIGEYIIYMYQMEDLIRAYQFNIKDIESYVIHHYPISQNQKEETLAWFVEIAKRMKAEGLQETGHLASTQETVDQLAVIHWDLLKKDSVYFNIYQKAKPHIMEISLASSSNPPKHEIQACINGIYGLLLARLAGKEVKEEMQLATEAFGDLLSYLNTIYFLRKNEHIRNN
jgi:hypothetical protein